MTQVKSLIITSLLPRLRLVFKAKLIIGLVTVLFSTVTYHGNAFAEENPEFYEQVYLTEKQALDQVFPGSNIEKKDLEISPVQRKIIQKRLRRKVKEDKISYFIARKNEQIQGYAWIMDEDGKHFPITFIVSVSPSAKVEQVAVMVYRERRGDAVKRKRFLNQFQNKTTQDRVEVNSDIIHLTGATISSWSIASGVKRALILTEELLLKKE